MSTIEDRIRELLTMDVPSHVLSNALFGPGGLFNQIAHTEQERRQISQTHLFQQANSRITELSTLEASEAREEWERKVKQRKKVAVKSQTKRTSRAHAPRANSTRRVSGSNSLKKYRKSG